jgi:adenylate cyclase
MPPRLRFGDVEIDVDAFELRRAGTLHPVEPQVFELVCYLARNAGRLVTKDELIEQIWNGRIVSDATLASRIKSARRAIGDDGEQQKWIRTVHGRGVRFVGECATARAMTEAAIDAPSRPAIAVLPFECLSARPEPDYLADGLTEDIITDLSRVSGLLVVARNTVYAYRDRPVDIQKIAERLKVAYVLEGSIRRADGRVRITAQLIDARSGGHVWAERYDRELSDIFALQDEISQSIVAALRITLLPEELAAITHRATSNTEAYQYYQMGRSYFLQTGWGQRAMQAARQMFVKATEVDAGYARAYAAIANCDSYLLCMGDPDASFESILANCARALELEPDLADAHAAKGLALFTAGRGEEASAALERAMTLAPDSFEAHFFAGRCRRARGHFARAAELFERAAELQPDDFRALGLAAYAYRSLGKHDEARVAARRCLERIEGELAVHADDAKALAFGAAILADIDQGARAREWAERASRMEPSDLLTNYNLACAWVALGQNDSALSRLEKMFAVPAGTRRLHLDWMRHDIALVPLRDHPRYLALVRHLEADAPPARVAKGGTANP